jgi:chemotaxis protein histidine kinase CheA/ActR/RegA family two-component response regulator
MNDSTDDRPSLPSSQLVGDSASMETRLTDEELAVLAAFQARGPRPSAWKPPVPIQRDADDDDAAAGELLSDEMPAQHPLAPDDLDVIPLEIKRAFIVEAGEALEALRTWTLRFERGDQREAAVELGNVAHHIRGTAATMGFDVLAELMLIYEDVAKVARRHSSSRPPATLQTLLALLNPIEQALLATAEEQPADPGLIRTARTLCDDLLAAGSPDFVATHEYSAGAADNETLAAEAVGFIGGDVAGNGDADSDVTRPMPAVRAPTLLRVEPHRLDELIAHTGSLALGRGALLRTRDDLARLHADFEQMVLRVNQLTDQLADLRPVTEWPPADTVDRSDPPRGKLRGRIFGRVGGHPHARNEQTADAAALLDGRLPRSADDLERFTEFDQTLIALREAVDDLMTTGRILRNGLRELGRIGDEQAGLVSAIQDDMLRIRLVPFGDLVPRLEVEARQLAQTLGKSITFTVWGEMTALDRQMCDGLAEPLRQLIRNALVHGIEPPAERIETGKPATGSVWLRAEHVGSDVVIEIGDDGRGVNPHRLVAAAMAANLLSAEDALAFSSTQALDLMFQLGVSTADAPSIHGGHGVGLSDVRTAIERLRGSITARQEPAGGTIFRIRVPITLSAVHALIVHASGFSYALPFAAITTTASLQASELLVSIERDGTGNERRRTRIRVAPQPVMGPADTLAEHTTNWEEIPAESLASLLGFAHEHRDPQPALVIEVGQRRAALLVDDLLGEHDVVVQALPAHLQRRLVRGATVTPTGKLLWLLDPAELLNELGSVHLTARPMHRAAPVEQDASLAPSVLVVDDSVSIRHTLQQTLTRAGFTVQLARDGIEALDLMLAHPPRVLLLDIEMPRLDGFELLAIMRDTPALTGIPVAMLTSRAAPRHQKLAHDLGVAAYLIKPCPEETLIQTVQALTVAPVMPQ